MSIEITCQRTIHMTAFYGKAGTRKCGKKPTHRQLDGLPICEHHYNKLMKKINKSKQQDI